MNQKMTGIIGYRKFRNFGAKNLNYRETVRLI